LSVIDTLLCPSIIPHMIGLGQSWILYKIFGRLEALYRVKEIYGYSSLTVELEDDTYMLITLYRVVEEEYRIYDVVEGDRWFSIAGKVLAVKPGDLKKYLKMLKTSIYSKMRDKLREQGAWCIGRREKTCLVSTGDRLSYGSTYLLLTLHCREESLEIRADEFFDTVIETMRSPIVNLVEKLSRREKVDDEIKERVIDDVDENLLVFVTDLIMRNRIIIPDIKSKNDLINYVKSHFKW
jgi:hypothetical protein